MTGFRLKFRWGRFIWTVLVTIYFLIFFTNFFPDAAPGRAVLPTVFSWIFVLWLGLEYYFGFPFFQSGMVEPHALWRALFGFYVYPLLGYVGADYIWWHWTQIPVPLAVSGVMGLVIFGLGTYIRLSSLFGIIRIIQTRPGGDNLIIPPKKFFGLRLQRLCRHPRYLGTLIQLIGASLVFNSFGGLGLVLIPGLPLIIAQVRYEDRALLAKMRPDYEPYSQTVPLLLPVLNRSPRKVARQAPDRYRG